MSFTFTVKIPDSINIKYVCVFQQASILIHCTGNNLSIPTIDELSSSGITCSKPVYFGHENTAVYYSAELIGSVIPENFVIKPLRDLFGVIDEHLFSIALKGLQINSWERCHQYCGKCGSPMTSSEAEFAKICTKCKFMNFPRISPAIIVAIVKESSILLARNARSQMYSVVAGYVEAGESLEETVVREVQEEVGVKVKNIRYFGNQPWAFSDSLMLAFTAEYESGEITPDGIEITEAHWFTKETIPPNIPRPLSVARKLIDWFICSR